jgi:hypothetical protein
VTGNSISLNVIISSVRDLYAFQFDLSFDPGTVSAVSITEGSFLTGGGATVFLPGTIDNIGGTIASTADSLIGAIPGVNGSGTLAILTLTGLALGTSSIDFSNVILLDSSLNSIAASSQSGSVTVTSTGVPEPKTLVLLIAGMSLLAFKLLRRPKGWCHHLYCGHLSVRRVPRKGPCVSFPTCHFLHLLVFLVIARSA